MKMPEQFEPEQIRAAASLMTSLGSEARLQILCRLTEGEASVNRLAESCGLSQPAMSQQLKRLREAGLVSARRSGQTLYYSIASDDVGAVLGVLRQIFCPDP